MAYVPKMLPGRGHQQKRGGDDRRPARRRQGFGKPKVRHENKPPPAFGTPPGFSPPSPGGGAAAASAPAPWTPPPLEAYAPYRAAQAAGLRDRTTVHARYGTGGGTFEQKYGNEGVQARGHYGLIKSDNGFEIDVSNPYGQAALLQKSYQQGQRGTSTSLAARGHLYSGAMQNALQHGTSQYNAGHDQLIKGYTGTLDDITEARIDLLADIADREQAARDEARAWAQSQRPSAPNVAQPSAPAAPAAPPAPPGSPPGVNRAKYYTHPLVQQTQRRAERLWRKGHRKGRVWGDIISMLGYDPRRGGSLRFEN